MSEIILGVVIAAVAADLAYHFVAARQARAFARRQLEQQTRNACRVVIECDATQALEQIAKVKAAAIDAAETVGRLH